MHPLNSVVLYIHKNVHIIFRSHYPHTSVLNEIVNNVRELDK